MSAPSKGQNYNQFEAMLKEGSSVTRNTVGNRVLTYILKVIQQPERARACGSGLKSSADRCPVDAPPVIGLFIFELKNGVQTNITFSYDASFFMFATLEVAQRHREPPNYVVPVLTGCPVSSGNYLDRPDPGVFFIFPDLLVRHEGRYRLCFHLYETTKNLEDRDGNETKRHFFPRKEHPTNADNPSEVAHRRLEIKSAVFMVYSTENVPGLAESKILRL
jgi:hypothetical protein